jgi:hypothetical protein
MGFEAVQGAALAPTAAAFPQQYPASEAAYYSLPALKVTP